MTLDEKLKEFEVNNCDSLGVEVNCQPCWELLAALRRCREQSRWRNWAKRKGTEVDIWPDRWKRESGVPRYVELPS
jgi:hypothetical protein